MSRFAYVANTGDNTVSIYTVNAATGQLHHDGYVEAGSQPEFVAVDPSGKFAYVANYGSGDISAYAINTGTGALARIPCTGTCNGSNFPAGSNPTFVAVDPTGRFAYVTNGGTSPADGGISAYRIDASTGALTRIPCSGPSCSNANFLAGDYPVSFTTDPTGKYAYVANSHSLDVTVFAIDPDTGALTRTPCTGTSCSGSGTNFATGSYPQKVVIDSSGKFAYVVNYGIAGTSGGTISQFTLGANGALTPNVAAATIAAGTGSFTLAIDPTGRFAYVTNNNSNDVSAYSINVGTGTLTRIICTGAPGTCSGSNFPAGERPLTVTIDPTGKFVYVTNSSSDTVSTYAIAGNGALSSLPSVASRSVPVALALTKGTSAVTYTPKFVYAVDHDNNKVSSYSINADTGTLTSIGAAVDTGQGPISITVDPAGRFAYVANSDGGGIVAYAIDAATGQLSNIGSVPAGSSPSNVAIDPAGRFAYVTNAMSGDISAYTIKSDGTLTPNDGNVSSGAGNTSAPNCIAIDPSGRFAYVANRGTGSNNVSVFNIDPITGRLTKAGADVAAGNAPNFVAIDPTGKFAYVSNVNSADVSVFGIDTSSGTLSSTGMAASTGGGYGGGEPLSVAVDPAGKFVYAANFDPGGITAFGVYAGTGALTSIGPEATGGAPISVTIDPSGKFAYVAHWSNTNSIAVYKINAATGAWTSVGGANANGFYSVAVAGTWK